MKKWQPSGLPLLAFVVVQFVLSSGARAQWAPMNPVTSIEQQADGVRLRAQGRLGDQQRTLYGSINLSNRALH